MPSNTTPPTTVEALAVDPATVLPHPDNPRKVALADDALVASVKAKGVLEPLLLAPVPDGIDAADGQDLILIAGHRRLDASLRAGLDLVPAIVRRDLDTRAAQIEVMIAENLARQDLTPLEEGDAYLMLFDLDMSQAQVAEHTGMPKGRVSERSRIAKLPPAAREQIIAGQVTLDAALALARVKDEDELQRIAAGPTYAWEREAGLAVRAEEQAKEEAKTRKALTDAGVTILDEDSVPVGALDLSDLDLLVVAADALGVDEEKADEDTVTQWHQENCSGHAVIETIYQSWGRQKTVWDPVCTTPEEHGWSPDGGVSEDDDEHEVTAGQDDQAAAVEAVAVAEAEMREALAAAAKTRRAWLADLLADTNRAGGAVWAICKAGLDGATAKGAPRRHPLVLGWQENGEGGDIMRQLLAGVTDGYIDAGTAADVVRTWAESSVEAMPAPRMALATFLSGHASAEWYLGEHRAEWKSGDYGYALPWIRTLDAIRYPWTAAELEWLDRVPAADDQDDDEDDAGEVSA